MDTIATIVPEKLYSTKEVSELLELNEKTVQRYCKKGKIKATKFGNKYKIVGQNLLDFLQVTI